MSYALPNPPTPTSPSRACCLGLVGGLKRYSDLSSHFLYPIPGYEPFCGCTTYPYRVIPKRKIWDKSTLFETKFGQNALKKVDSLWKCLLKCFIWVCINISNFLKCVLTIVESLHIKYSCQKSKSNYIVLFNLIKLYDNINDVLEII